MITEINDKIFTNYNKEQKKAVRSITKNGFVNVDGNFMQYNPRAKEFVKVTDEFILQVLFNSMGNNWSFVSANERLETLKSELPNLTTKDVEDFKTYMQWIDVPIDSALIKELMDKAIAENELYKNTKADFKSKLNLQSELIVLRNNDIFTDNDFRLFHLKEGKLERYTVHDVLGLFRSTIGTENTKLVMQYVKNHWKSYIDSLTNVKKLLFLLKQKEEKETTMKDAKPGFEKCLKVVSKYQ